MARIEVMKIAQDTTGNDWTPSIVAFTIPVGFTFFLISHRVSAMLGSMLLIYAGLLLFRAKKKQSVRPLVIVVCGFALAFGLSLYAGK